VVCFSYVSWTLMKLSVMALTILLPALVVTTSAFGGDRPVTKIVKQLQNMLDASEKEGEDDQKLFAKFQCFCDSKEKTLKDEISSATTNIAAAHAQIMELKGSTGELSMDVAKLRNDIMANEQQRQTHQENRDKAHQSFNAEKTDLTDAMDQMQSAIDTLQSVGADQTSATGGDSAQFLRGNAKSAALLSIKAFISPEQREKLSAFLQQAPGNYASKSGEIFGILANMNDDYQSKLLVAEQTEASQLAAFNKLKADLTAEYDEMKESLATKLDQLSTNDEARNTAQSTKEGEQQAKDTSESTLADLTTMCDTREKEYDARVALRSEEGASIAKAIQILNSDEAHASFGATSSGGGAPTLKFLQLANIRKHRATAGESILKLASKIKGGPVEAFETLFAAIDKMIAVIDKESKSDDDLKAWCTKTLDNVTTEITMASDDISAFDGSIAGKQKELDEETDSLADNEARLADTLESISTLQSDRKAANAEFLEHEKNINAAIETLDAAIDVLAKYYEGDSFTSATSAASYSGPTVEGAPDTQDQNHGNAYKGQDGGGVLGLLRRVRRESADEKKDAAHEEASAVDEFNTQLAKLTDDKTSYEESIETNREILSGLKYDIVGLTEERESRQREKTKLTKYKEEITPKCSWIERNYDERDSNRKAEKASLQSASDTLADAPQYVNAKKEQDGAALGKCRADCEDSPDTAQCKACQQGTTVAGYCTGHPSAPGC